MDSGKPNPGVVGALARVSRIDEVLLPWRMQVSEASGTNTPDEHVCQSLSEEKRESCIVRMVEQVCSGGLLSACDTMKFVYEVGWGYSSERLGSRVGQTTPKSR